MMLKTDRCARLPQESGMGPCRPGMLTMLMVCSWSNSPMAGESVEVMLTFSMKNATTRRYWLQYACVQFQWSVPGCHSASASGLPNCSLILSRVGRSGSLPSDWDWETTDMVISWDLGQYEDEDDQLPGHGDGTFLGSIHEIV